MNHRQNSSRTRRTRLAMSLVALATVAAGAVGIGASPAVAATNGYTECAGTYFEGAITVHPGVAPKGYVAHEYLFVASGSQWVYTGLHTWATSLGNGYWNTTWNVMSFSPLPYHQRQYIVQENLYNQYGQYVGYTWYRSYDNGAFTYPRYTSTCFYV